MDFPKVRRSWVEIESAAISHNFSALLRHAAPQSGIICVIKADAYGHGAANAIAALPQAALFAVATLEEALAIRHLATPRPILLLSPSFPDEYATLVHFGFIPTVSSAKEASALATFAQASPVPINVGIDTGMGRAGIPQANALEELDAIRDIKGVRVDFISTHLPSADEESDFTTGQLSEIARGIREWKKRFPDARIHVANSACSLAFPEAAYDLLRPGIALYGIAPVPQFQHLLRAALTWKTRVNLVREVGAGQSISYGRTFITKNTTRLATLAVGYADGFPRHLSNTAHSVLIRGKRCPILGRVTMDQTVADATDLPDINVGDEAVLIGRQENEEITASELAAKAGTIAWEILSRIGQRVPRIGV